MLNEVGGRSPYKGGSETTFSGGVSLDSDQKNALTSAMGKIGLSDSVGCPPKSQLLEVKDIYILLYFSFLLLMP